MSELGETFLKDAIERIPTEGIVIFGFSWLCLQYLKELHKVKSILCSTVEWTLFGLIISGLFVTLATVFKPKKSVKQPAPQKPTRKFAKT
jgi:hypothetical protein